jgi:hypothetical protein
MNLIRWFTRERLIRRTKDYAFVGLTLLELRNSFAEKEEPASPRWAGTAGVLTVDVEAEEFCRGQMAESGALPQRVQSSDSVPLGWVR